MNRFFIYEEYGAKYELMIKDVASAHRTMPKWESYQKGLETLAAALGTGNSHDDHLRKSLTIGDLLVKVRGFQGTWTDLTNYADLCQPIQRVCRYPLLFAELLKYTPVCDYPHSHMEIEDTLARLREATAEINRATDNSKIKDTLEKTWILQDRLVFPDRVCSYKPRVKKHTNPQIEYRRRIQEPDPVTRTCSALWCASHMLADERGSRRQVHGLAAIPRLALSCRRQSSRSDIHSAGLHQRHHSQSGGH